MVFSRRRRRFATRRRRTPYRRYAARRRRFIRRRGVQTGIQPRSVVGIAPRQLVKLKYSSNGSLNITGGSQKAQYSYNLNSLYDPDRTGGGHQPRYYDQWMTLYNYYRVYACKYTIRGATNVANVLTACTIATPYAPPTYSFSEDVSELPFTTTRVLQFQTTNYNHSAKISLPKLLGETRTQFMGDDANTGSISTSPAQVACITLAIFPTDPANVSNQDLQYTIDLVYYAELFNIINVASS